MPRRSVFFAVLLAAAATFAEDRGASGRDGACADPLHRQFDFWVGNFDVFSKVGNFVATNLISKNLDGCVVEEHWVPLSGARGRSLSAYDVRDGHWHQTWVAEDGRPFRMTGGLRDDGVMSMRGERHPWFGRDLVWIDAFTWAQIDDKAVVQAFTFDIPSSKLHLEGALTYRPDSAPPAIAAAGTDNCSAGDASDTRRLDFTLGRFSVRTAAGKHLGNSEIALDPTLSGCLLEESFEGQGLHATGWLYYDPVEDRFYRTVLDDHGGRTEVFGQFAVDGSLVLQGPFPQDGAPNGLLRVTLRQASANEIDETIEVSRDGQTFPDRSDLVYARK
jgi:hypothetical protein